MIKPLGPEGQFESDSPKEQAYLDVLNAILEKESAIINQAPDPEMGGLSPNQVHPLIYSKPGKPGSPIQFESLIPYDLLKTSSFFSRARTLLEEVVKAGGVKATKGKNLGRKFVEHIVSATFNSKDKERFWFMAKKLDEEDVWPLHIVRVVCEEAKLLRLYKGVFVATKRGKELLKEDLAGELFEALFLTYFFRLNLSYNQRFNFDTNCLQQCVTYSLYRLGKVAENRVPAKGLAAEILLPMVKRNIEQQVSGDGFLTLDYITLHFVLEPLVEWGLLEGGYEESAISTLLLELQTVRVTPLYHAFFRFQFDG
ncbi:MAG: hypothetical protein ACO398_09385 [Kiritimatiellia bacterium]|jgi:hypothetical protein